MHIFHVYICLSGLIVYEIRQLTTLPSWPHTHLSPTLVTFVANKCIHTTHIKYDNEFSSTLNMN